MQGFAQDGSKGSRVWRSDPFAKRLRTVRGEIEEHTALDGVLGEGCGAGVFRAGLGGAAGL